MNNITRFYETGGENEGRERAKKRQKRGDGKLFNNLS